MSILSHTYSIQYFRILAKLITAEGEQGGTNRKEVRRLSLLSDEMILCIKDPKDSTRKLRELINTFRKIEGCQINMQNLEAFLYPMTNTENNQEMVPFTIASKNIYG